MPGSTCHRFDKTHGYDSETWCLDLRLKPYDILARGPKSGLVEFVQNSVFIVRLTDI